MDTHKTIGKQLKNGNYEKEFHHQGWIYKNRKAFNAKQGVCYIPELSDEKYYYEDFLALCDGNEELASDVFEVVDWQHPETYVGELESIGIEPP